MICYRDMTFCPYHVWCRSGRTCPYKLTRAVKAKAKQVGLPICKFIEKPDCFSEVKRAENK